MKGNCNCVAPEQAKEGLHCAVAAQEKKTKQEGDAVVACFATLRYVATQHKKKKGDGNVAVVIFFVALHNKKHKEEEEGDGVVAVAFFVELERSSTTGRRNKKRKKQKS
jgi:hypothetical protein